MNDLSETQLQNAAGVRATDMKQSFSLDRWDSPVEVANMTYSDYVFFLEEIEHR